MFISKKRLQYHLASLDPSTTSEPNKKEKLCIKVFLVIPIYKLTDMELYLLL